MDMNQQMAIQTKYIYIYTSINVYIYICILNICIYKPTNRDMNQHKQEQKQGVNHLRGFAPYSL